MGNYVSVFKFEDSVGVTFDIEDKKVLAIGEKMNEICDKAYMNGYNWDMFLNYYLENNAPNLLEGLESDPEAGMYYAGYDLNEENEKKAEELVKIISSLIENEEKLYSIVRENSDEIEWD